MSKSIFYMLESYVVIVSAFLIITVTHPFLTEDESLLYLNIVLGAALLLSLLSLLFVMFTKDIRGELSFIKKYDLSKWSNARIRTFLSCLILLFVGLSLGFFFYIKHSISGYINPSHILLNAVIAYGLVIFVHPIVFWHIYSEWKRSHHQ